ncbi:unnamed protein product [Acanthoscelides obtectus]|uniref:Uncharacterized protein n=1 Tax=Acanthoscelides obtectus TaxID=200917 RepID=A0A9P0KV29_ACAOB|nr:unnamed protein product [Acanthoscelides obtectus]CAK1665984.1 hypothetical protein AOBTE_LOCUS25093 [Acanthoscelides obtectus]
MNRAKRAYTGTSVGRVGQSVVLLISRPAGPRVVDGF